MFGSWSDGKQLQLAIEHPDQLASAATTEPIVDLGYLHLAHQKLG